MLETDSVWVSKEKIRLRFIVSFPSTSKGGGSFNGRQAKIMFEKELTQIARYSLVYSGYDEKSCQQLKAHIRVIEDRNYIHTFLSRNNGISFIPDTAVLPRMSGVDDRPLESDTITSFKSPDSLAVEVALPHRRHIRGMMLKAGVIMITGGGFHGKSTLLQAIESGIYPHIPGDGRERVVTRFDAVTVRASEGRRIEKVNISPFIRNLPDKKDTCAFSTENASGSTSQAAGIIEALETGSRLLLFDEDTCALNLLVRDHLIEKIIPVDHEPITPLYDTVRTMWEDSGISSLLILELKHRLNAKTDTPPAIMQLIDDLYSELDEKGLFGLNHDFPGTLSYPIKFELAAAVNRMRSLKVADKKDLFLSAANR